MADLLTRTGPDYTSVEVEAQAKTQEADEVKCIIEKATMVQLGLAFAVAVKHYLRGEEGMCVRLVLCSSQSVRRMRTDSPAVYTRTCTTSSGTCPPLRSPLPFPIPTRPSSPLAG